ncbi:MAG: transglycosylase SLT domain-containing protein, partial [Bdellovibrionota bacterium]
RGLMRQRLKAGFACVMAAGFLHACASLQPNPITQPAEDIREPAAAKVEEPAPTAAPDSVSEINKIIAETNHELSEQNGENDKAPLQIPVEINRKVEEWIKYFTEREHDMTTRYLERGEPLRPHIEAILKENEVPADLYYLAMIESGFVPQAKSRAKAVGIWQFVKGTGKNYKMTINSSVDERRNWIKATEAAANYLKDLHNVFGSWYLALAAYNSGEYKIVRSIMKGKTRDFWVLAERGLLPQETMDYVPKYLAAQLVAKNYKRLGFTLNISADDEWADWDSVSVPSGVKLSDISKKTGVELAVLKRWNRDLIKGITPFSRSGSVDIYIPKTEVAKFDAAKEEIAKLTRHLSRRERQRIARGEVEDTYGFYVVRRGDNLSTISKHIGISTRTLMKINGLRRGRIHPGQRLKYYGSGTATADNGHLGKKKKRDPASDAAEE